MVRFGRFLLWVLLLFSVSLALLVTALRVVLPDISRVQPQIEQWLQESTGQSLQIEKVTGFWRNTHPSFSLDNVQLDLGGRIQDLTIERVSFELDLVESLLSLSPRLSELKIHGINLDISEFDLAIDNQSDSQNKDEQDVGLQALESLFFEQLSDFALSDSMVTFLSRTGEIKQLHIKQLMWRNQGDLHQIQGTIDTSSAELRAMKVIANFTSQHGFRDMTGEFFLDIHSLQLAPWLASFLPPTVNIEHAQLSVNAWLTLDDNRPIDAFLRILPSELKWNDGQSHSFSLDHGDIRLTPQGEGVKILASNLQAKTDSNPWPALDAAIMWQPDLWVFNLSQLSLDPIRPLLSFAPQAQEAYSWLKESNLKLHANDIRISTSSNFEKINYSANFNNVKMEHWQWLPSFEHLNVSLFGNQSQAHAHIRLLDDTLDYGDMFQAPLNVRYADNELIWQRDDKGWRIWSPKLSLATPDLKFLGAFKLDFPKQASPFLSLYGEAELSDAGQTWRYLPQPLLGQGLTDYLSTAIQAGQVRNSQLLWYGELSQYPYQQHNGIFQAWVPLENAQFSFSTDWPVLNDLQLDLLFENESLLLDSSYAKLMDIKASSIKGKIPRLGAGGHIDIKASASGEGTKVRDYMMATPLVDSVGAALTTIEVKNQVETQFQLHVPFDDTNQSRAWGFARLKNNNIHINAPSIDLAKASGVIRFDNDQIVASGMKANLLGQEVAINFTGESQEIGYVVDLNIEGDWAVKRLAPYLGERWIAPVRGSSPWQMAVDLQLNDVGFTYQVDAKADLLFIESHYPAPFGRALGYKGEALMQASGNQESVSARLQLPQFKFQTEIDITQSIPVLEATNWILGSGSFKVSPIVGHHAALRMESFHFDKWLELLNSETSDASTSASISKITMPEIPLPHRIQVQTDSLIAGGIEWNDVQVLARKRPKRWTATLSSAQALGTVDYLENDKLDVALERLNIYIPSLDKLEGNYIEEALIYEDEAPLISEFDRHFHQWVPSLNVAIDDFWLQGYKVGKVDIQMTHDGNSQRWENISLVSGNSSLQANGSWVLTEDSSYSKLSASINSENNSEIMARFGINNGIQKAPFKLDMDLAWQGSPWGMRVRSLNGNLKTKVDKGVISGLGGAAKFLGMFSFDSIVRRLQLDFSDIFDEGLAFSSIKGDGKIENGVFVTNNLVVDSISGDMHLKGMVNLNKQLIDAEVSFYPDFTSGLPAISAFAVAPQTALYVLAVTTVIAPVVEVISKVTYGIKGSLNDPEVKEVSRRKKDFEVPEEYRNQSDN